MFGISLGKTIFVPFILLKEDGLQRLVRGQGSNSSLNDAKLVNQHVWD